MFCQLLNYKFIKLLPFIRFVDVSATTAAFIRMTVQCPPLCAFVSARLLRTFSVNFSTTFLLFQSKTQFFLASPFTTHFYSLSDSIFRVLQHSWLQWVTKQLTLIVGFDVYRSE